MKLSKIYKTQTTDQPYDLQRFLLAQQNNFASAINELADGLKQTHWIWYVFPQLIGLGSSPISIKYGLSGADVAKAYLEHPLLGSRLRECINTLLAHSDKSAESILGGIDAIKLRSCITLFANIEPGTEFSKALLVFFGGQEDPLTLKKLSKTVD